MNINLAPELRPPTARVMTRALSGIGIDARASLSCGTHLNVYWHYRLDPNATAPQPQQDPDYRVLARSLRPTLQTALLNWLRDASNTGALVDMGTVFDTLREQASFAPHEILHPDGVWRRA